MNEETIINQYRALLIGKFLTDISNTTAFLNDYLTEINWIGFYLLAEDNCLYLGPFQGKVACTTIPLNKGVCGHAATIRKTVVVDDVHSFAGHIACDSRTNSELVVPLVQDGKLLGVLDIDSPNHARFKNLSEIKLVERIVEELLLANR
jgi:GAF domain-containing protein